MISFFKKNKKVEALEEEISSLKKEVENLKAVAQELHDTLCIVTAAQYQIGSDVGVIYTTLKSLANPASSPVDEDDVFSFAKDEDDKGYLN